MARCLSCQRELPAPAAVCPFCGAESARAQFNDQLLDEVLSLLARKQKLEAVKVVKYGLNLSLMDAKNLVERLEAELPSTKVTTTASEQTTDEIPWHAGAKELLLQGKKLHAIKYCREQTGSSLREAKEQVEALAVQNGINPRSGCLGVVIAVAFIIATAVSLAY
jgi:ribosomal protein L7/L12